MSQNTNGYNNGGGYYNSNPTMGYGGLNTTQPPNFSVPQPSNYVPQTGGLDTSYNLPPNGMNGAPPPSNGLYGFNTMPYPIQGGGYFQGMNGMGVPTAVPMGVPQAGRPQNYPAASVGAGIGSAMSGSGLTLGVPAPGSQLAPTTLATGNPVGPSTPGNGGGTMGYVNPNQNAQNTQGLSALQVGLGMHYTPDGRLTF